MTFTHPWLGLLAAGIGIALLLALYFLKLRRQSLRIPSTLLWRSSFEDLQVNVPFQRLRWSLLLLLQLLLLLFIAAAIAQPRITGTLDSPSRLIVLLDQSASMATVVGPGLTRLDLAKRAASELAARLSESSDARSMMIVAFAASPRIIIGFESDRRTLQQVIASIEQTDEPANLDAALHLAGAFAQRGEGGEGDDPSRPGVVLISDGCVGQPGDAAGFKLRAGSFRFVPVPPRASASPAAVSNLGIVDCSARRALDDPTTVLLFVRIANAGDAPVDSVITVRIDDALGPVRRVFIPPATSEGPGEATRTFELGLPRGGIITVSHSIDDQLLADNAGAVIMPDLSMPRIAIVHEGSAPDPFLHDLLEATQPQELISIDRSTYENSVSAAATFDLVVFDRITGHALPAAPSLSVGGVPAGITITTPTTGGGKRLLSWLRQHPIMRYVSLDTLAYAGFSGMDLPASAESLAAGPDGSVIALLRSRGARHVVVGFSLAQSNWPTHVSLTVFIQNVLDDLLLATSGQTGRTLQTGEPTDVRISPSVTDVLIRGPVTRRLTIRSGDERTTIPGLPRVGLYQIDGAIPADRTLAVSLLSESETDIRPRDSVPITLLSGSNADGQSSGWREIWPWLVAAALCLAILEWIAYLWRVRI